MTLFQSLPTDIHDRILQFVDGLDTLIAAMLTCKSTYVAYHKHQNFIRLCALFNFIGPNALDAALRSVKIYKYMPTHHEPEPGQPGRPFVHVVKTDFSEAAMIAQTVSDDEFKLLAHLARVCNELEVLYSRWHKDRLTDRTSLLTASERDNFRCSIYRLWLLSLYTGPTSIVQEHFKTVEQRAELFYNDYTPQEVYNLHSVIDWMHEVVRQCELPDGRTQNSYHLQCIVAGPETVLNIYTRPDKSRKYLEGITLRRLNASTGDAWRSDLQYVFKKRHLLGPSETEARIPDSIAPMVATAAVPVLTCWKCGEHPGARVWNEDNWNYAPLSLRLESLVHWLPGALKNNTFERPLFLHFLGVPDPMAREQRGHARRKKQDAVKDLVKTIPGLTVSRVLRALCKLPPHEQDILDVDSLPLEPDDFEGIKCTDLLCETCLGEMVTSRLWILWLKEKERAAPSEAEKGNCWFGIDCRLQSFKPDHASFYNHACRNTWPERKARKLADEEVAAVRAAEGNVVGSLVPAPSVSTVTA
ncbi:hypothetical protein EXIGLDRAFT_747893 [Exidia glandulosa HHB12029]|uniref:Aprataxin and PNK-like factor PBZ domain-containing protein n=1 Tax=Exidia glandulosa HHB12029 TaxID=1314781 RepID=A0A165K7R9_EXIGL|nr:hypothetical protein EXIGLDRAFT_747893 [Exidia glandulosa HHB12029]